MKKQPNKKIVGLFTLTGIAMFCGAILLFLGDKIFMHEEDFLVMYFEESVKGLYVGSPVVLRGVEIGKVRKIDLITDTQNVDFKIPVYADLDKDKFKSIEKQNEKEIIESIIAKGLKARLQTQSLLTGQLMIELEIIPDSQIVYRGKKGEMEIPTVLSPMGLLSAGVKDLNIKQIIDNLNNLLSSANHNLPEILSDLSIVMKNMKEITATRSSDREGTIDNLNKTIKDVGDAAQALRSFADYVERHPESLIRGKGGY